MKKVTAMLFTMAVGLNVVSMAAKAKAAEEQETDVLLIGGGIMSATDVVEFLLAGATAVQVGTASFVTPGIAQQIAHDLEQWMQDKGVADVRSLIGALQMA